LERSKFYFIAANMIMKLFSIKFVIKIILK